MIKSKTKEKKQRAPYGFKLKFPSKFTISRLLQLKGGTIQYITIRKRVDAALKDGSIVLVGKEKRNSKGAGRPQMIYQRVDAKTPIVSSAKLEQVAA